MGASSWGDGKVGGRIDDKEGVGKVLRGGKGRRKCLTRRGAVPLTVNGYTLKQDEDNICW